MTPIRRSVRSVRRFALVAFVAGGGVLGAQAAPMPKGALATSPPLVVTLMRDAQGVGEKMIALAKAIPADKYDWRPAPGVRSIREVMLHVASDNYLIPAMLGTAAPSSTGITAKDMAAVGKFEKRTMSRDSVVAELTRSFTHLAGTMGKVDAQSMTATADFFGQKMPMQDVWVGTTTHLHEHLGQSIAYARMNGVTPPWSK